MKIITLLILVFTQFIVFSQGPVDGYNKGKGKLEVGLGFSNEEGDKFYAGRTLINSSRNIKSYTFFSIYGITNKLDVQLNIPYININKGAEQNLQDGSIYLKYAFFKKNNLTLLGAGGFYLPLSNYQTQGGDAIGQLNKAFDIRLIAQQNFKNSFFVSAQAGYFIKTSPTPHAFSTALKLGLAKSKIYADVWVELNQAIGGTDYRGTGNLAPTPDKGGFKSLGYSYTRIGSTLYSPIYKNLGGYLGTAYTINGRNILKGPRISAGLIVTLINSNN